MMFSEMLDQRQVSAGTCFNPAEVIDLGNKQSLLIRFLDDPAEREFSAKSALENPAALQCGDHVLVAGDHPQTLYIIGVLSSRRPVAGSSIAALPGGGVAEIPAATSSDALRVLSPAGELVMEYHCLTGRIHLNAGAGGIEFSSELGDISFRSGKQIRMEADAVSLQARHTMTLDIAHTLRGILSSLRLTGESTRLRTAKIGVETAQCDLQLDQANLKSDLVHAEIDKIKLKSRRSEVSVETLITRAKNVYQTIEELCQHCCGRLRMIVRGTWHSRSQNTHLHTHEDFKVKADQIHLG